MKHKTFLAYLVLATALTTGCLKVQNKNEAAKVKSTDKTKMAAPKVPPVEITRELRLDDVFVEYIGQNQPDLYDVSFSWPQTRDRIRLTVEGQPVSLMDTRENLKFEIQNVQGGRKLSVLIEILDQEDHIIAFETRELEIPKDYIFPKNFTLTNDTKITNQRVFMNGSTVTTHNFNLVIKTQHLIVLEKSHLQNFDEQQKAKPISNGRNGGEIRIEAQLAEGELNVTLNSEAGGDGFKGVAPVHCNHGINQGFCFYQSNCPQGGSGWNAGLNGSLFVKVDKVDNLKLYPQYTLSEGGRPGPAAGVTTADDYPVFQGFLNINKSPLLQCPKTPVPGLGAQPGRICLTYSGQIPQAGCE